MTIENDILREEIPILRQITQDEIWLEGERRGCAVSSHDPVVIDHVAEIIMAKGQSIRNLVRSKLGLEITHS
jgi:hypothetical protein